MSREAIPDNREGSCIVPILLGSLSSLSLSTIFRLSAACGPSPASSSAKHFAYTQSEARLVYLPTAYAFVLSRLDPVYPPPLCPPQSSRPCSHALRAPSPMKLCQAQRCAPPGRASRQAGCGRFRISIGYCICAVNHASLAASSSQRTSDRWVKG